MVGFLTAMIASPSANGAEIRPMSIVALGTSLTANQVWPEALAARLTECLHRPVNIGVVAKAGATSAWGLKVAPKIAANKPDVVLIEFAVNDSALQRMMLQQTSIANLRAIIAATQAARSDVLVAVLTMNPAHGLRSWIRLRRSSFEAAHRAVALEQGALHIDLRDSWSRVPANEMQRMMPDGLHPDAVAAARVIVPHLAAQIGGKGCKA